MAHALDSAAPIPAWIVAGLVKVWDPHWKLWVWVRAS